MFQLLILPVCHIVIRVVSFLLYKLLKIKIRTTRNVGIFTREAENNYRFLQDFLTSSDRVINEVRPFAITNSGHQEFREEVGRCDAAILYHSKRRGRVNITDVTDALYNEELEQLSRQLGKSNVIVVADHLESSSPEGKKRILQNQPRIQEMTSDLFLFSERDNNERKLQDHMNTNLQNILSVINQDFRIFIDSQRGCGIPILTPLFVNVLRIFAFLLEYIIR
ncbi:uncharacterized protein LOC142097153 [Mixophyes fleayi]|uniref:uncharacterized protein LOC142097153 n=1 Tax=Mixophyes fleayi TaxID=3061075 RepID=UPI003F4E1564